MKLVKTEAAYTGGGIYVAITPTTYHGQNVIMAVDSEEIGYFCIYAEGEDPWELNEIIDAEGTVHNLKYYGQEITEAYKRTILALIEEMAQ